LISSPQLVFNDKSINKILILRHDRIGDLIISQSFLRILRETLPNAQIDLLLSYKNAGASFIIRNYVDNIFIYSKNFFQNFRLLNSKIKSMVKDKRYNLIIDLFDNQSTRSNLLIKLIKHDFALGMEKENSHVYSHIVPLLSKKEFHIIDRISNLLLPFGIDPNLIDLSLSFQFEIEEIENIKHHLGFTTGKKILGIVLSGSDRGKYIGTENIISFLQRFGKSFVDIEPVLFSTEDYKNELNEICSATGYPAIPFANTFREYTLMLSQCHFIITPDTSAVHIASMFKIPCVAIFKIQENADIPWIPYKSKHVSLTVKGETLDKISSEEIFQAFCELQKFN